MHGAFVLLDVIMGPMILLGFAPIIFMAVLVVAVVVITARIVRKRNRKK